MKIKDLNLFLKFLLIISVFITGAGSILGLFYLTSLVNNTKIICAQDLSDERVLIYEWNNIKSESIGSNRYRFTMEMSVPYKIYVKGDTLINESKYGSVKYIIVGKENYAGRANNGNWEDIFEINADSVVYEFDTEFVIGMKNDTVVFKKDDNEVLRLGNFKISDEDENIINVSSVVSDNNKVIYKFNRADMSEAVRIDPTWDWQLGASEGKDARACEGLPDDNYGTAEDVYTGMSGGGTDNISYIQFEGWADSIGTCQAIDSVFIFIYEKTKYDSPEVYIARITQYWEESSLTWNNRPTYSSPYSADTLDSASDSSWWKFNVTSLFQDYYAGTYADSGQAIVDNQHVSGSMLNFYTSDYATAGKRPKIEIQYRLVEDLSLDLTALSDSSIECTVDTAETGYIDSFVIMSSIDSSAMSDVFYTPKDTLDTLSINTMYSLIAGGYIDDTLKYYSFPDSLYTLAVIPGSPFVQCWTTTSLRIRPKGGNNPSNVNLAIYDSTLQRYISSSGDTTSSAVWQTESQWDTLIAINRVPNTEYKFGVFAKNEDDSITAISGLKSCKTNSTIDSIEVCAVTDSSYVIYFGGDSVYSPFKGYFAIDDSDSSTASDTIDAFSYGIKSIFTNKSYSLNTLNRFRILRIENQADSLYYSDADSAYTLTATPTPPIISGTSDSTFLLQFDDVSGNPDTIMYAVFDSVYSMYRDTTGDTTETIVFATDVDWDNVRIKTYTPNLLVVIGIFGKNDDSLFSAVSSDTTWTWAAVPGTTMASVIDSTRLLIKINPNKNPEYTYFAVEDSISGKFIDINTGILRSSGVKVDSTWAFGRYSDWGGSEGFIITVTPKTNYYFRAYSKDGNTNP